MPLISDLSRLRVPVKALDTNGRNRPPICARFLLGRTCDKALTVCDICAPRPSALSRKTAELAGQIALSVTSEVPLMLYSYPGCLHTCCEWETHWLRSTASFRRVRMFRSHRRWVGVHSDREERRKCLAVQRASNSLHTVPKTCIAPYR